MGKYRYILLLISGLAFSQAKENPFAAAENKQDGGVTRREVNSTTPSTGNPGDPAPVDNYLPELLLTAAALILFSSSKIKKYSNYN